MSEEDSCDHTSIVDSDTGEDGGGDYDIEYSPMQNAAVEDASSDLISEKKENVSAKKDISGQDHDGESLIFPDGDWASQVESECVCRCQPEC